MEENKAQSMAPVPPDGMELLVFYKCPYCSRHMAVPAPIEPRMIPCDACHRNFSIIPVDEFGLHFLRIITAGGRATADPDFL